MGFKTVLGDVEWSVSRRRKGEALGTFVEKEQTELHSGALREPADSVQSDFGSLTECAGREVTNPNRRSLPLGVGAKGENQDRDEECW